MYYNRKKYILKNVIIITFILLVAIIATHAIYDKFTKERETDYSSESLDIVFHDVAGANVDITKPTLVNDAIGLSSKAYTLTIKNNLTEPVKYKLKLVDNAEKIILDDCAELQIPKELIRVSVKEDSSKNNIYTLSELIDNNLDLGEIDALAEKNYSIRIWLTNTSEVNISKNLHYHGIIQVIENETDLAVR
ncbi:MAG: hypothetical protein MSS28_01095 [Tenericutes bacterium]|nr:hypothetical protein [Mycoplasmatota bacterium]